MLSKSTYKDCLFGQIRAVDDNVYRNTGIDKTATPTTIPEAMRPYVKRQQIITWANATGMNPLWNKLSLGHFYETSYVEYGNMLTYAWHVAEEYGITFIRDLIPFMTATEYHEQIRKDYSNDYSLLCAALGFWWHIHLFMQQEDALDYAWTAFRQHDTWYYPGLEDEHMKRLFNTSDEPTMYVTKINTQNFPTTAFIQAFFYLLNRNAIAQLRDNFFVLILQEIQKYYDLIGKRAKQIYGKSGVILHNVCVKNDIKMINVDEKIGEIYCWIPTARSPTCSNYGRNERNVSAVDI